MRYYVTPASVDGLRLPYSGHLAKALRLKAACDDFKAVSYKTCQC